MPEPIQLHPLTAMTRDQLEELLDLIEQEIDHEAQLLETNLARARTLLRELRAREAIDREAPGAGG